MFTDKDYIVCSEYFPAHKPVWVDAFLAPAFFIAAHNKSLAANATGLLYVLCISLATLCVARLVPLALGFDQLVLVLSL